MGTVNLPNSLSLLRLLLVPIVLTMAWSGRSGIVLILIAACFLTDALDGFLARALKQTSELGARLDSIADFTFYLSIPLATWWAWPEIFARERWFFLALLASVIVPALVAMLKFRTPTSYHTWLVKLAALATGISVLLLLALDMSQPFRISALISVVAACEEVLLSLVLSEPRSNVHSLWHVWQQRDPADSNRHPPV